LPRSPANSAKAKAPTESRRAKKQRETRIRLLEAAHSVMKDSGVDAARIADITSKADVGFGTFYNYFPDKDSLAREVLDCIIHDLGERITSVTMPLRETDMTLAMGISNRLVLRAAMADPVWRWWALRPDLLFDRMSRGVGPYALEDVGIAIKNGKSQLQEDQAETAWAMAVWVMVGGIHDLIVGSRPAESASLVAHSCMRVLGATHEDATRVTTTELPDIRCSTIDWSFQLGQEPAAAE